MLSLGPKNQSERFIYPSYSSLQPNSQFFFFSTFTSETTRFLSLPGLKFLSFYESLLLQRCSETMVWESTFPEADFSITSTVFSRGLISFLLLFFSQCWRRKASTYRSLLNSSQFLVQRVDISEDRDLVCCFFSVQVRFLSSMVLLISTISSLISFCNLSLSLGGNLDCFLDPMCPSLSWKNLFFSIRKISSFQRRYKFSFSYLWLELISASSSASLCKSSALCLSSYWLKSFSPLEIYCSRRAFSCSIVLMSCSVLRILDFAQIPLSSFMTKTGSARLPCNLEISCFTCLMVNLIFFSSSLRALTLWFPLLTGVAEKISLMLTDCCLVALSRLLLRSLSTFYPISFISFFFSLILN